MTDIGIHIGMTRQEYVKIPAMNISTLLHGEQSMLHLKYFLDHPAQKSSDALRLGIAVHLAAFEPSEFPKRVKKIPNVNRRITEGREMYDTFVADCAKHDWTPLNDEDYEQCIAMRDALRSYAPTREILDAKGVGELAVVWRDLETGLLLKGMLDRFCEWKGWPLVPDLKTTDDASEKSFRRSVVNYAYHVKCAFYMDGLQAIAKANRRFFWIALEKSQPHAIAIYEPDDDCMREGRKLYRRLLNQYAECLKTNVWAGYSAGPEPLKLPAWAKERIEFE